MNQETRTIGGSTRPGIHGTRRSRSADPRDGGYGWEASCSAPASMDGSCIAATNQSVMKTPSVPVAASVVKSGNLDIYISQIGTVTPFATVTVKSRIAGQITKIDFKEGQLVNAGDLLVNIDPSPYEAQLLSTKDNSSEIKPRSRTRR